jgi:glycosyltransferase involved in cell wall biosynthesis
MGTSKIRVLQTIRQGKVGGGESHLLDLVVSLDGKEFESTVLSFTDGPMIDKLKQFGVESYVIRTELPFNPLVWNRVRRLMIERKIDIVHAHGTRANSNVNFAARQLGIPVVYTIHGWSFHPDQSFIKKRMRIMGETFLTRRSTVNISVSESNRDEGKKIIRGFNSRVVHYGVNQDKFSRNRQYPDIRSQLRIPKDTILLLFLARMTSHKQPLTLLKGYRILAEKFKDIHLLMVGDGDQKDEALHYVEQNSLTGRVTFEGFRSDVPDILNAADVYILPSLWEGLPIGLLEAMHMGKTVIASKVDGTGDIIVNQENGLLLDTSNLVGDIVRQVEYVLMNRDEAVRMGKKAVETVQTDFNVQRMTDEIQTVYREVLKPSHRSV